MSSDTLHHRILEVLNYFGIQDNLHVQTIDLHDNQSYQTFLGCLTKYVARRHQELKPLDLNCLVTLLCEFTAVLKVKIKMDGDKDHINVDSDTENEDYLLELIALLPYCQPHNSAICKVLDIMRTSARIQQQEHVKIVNLQKQSTSGQQQSYLKGSISSAVTEWTNHNDIAFIPVRLHTHVYLSLQKCVAQDNPPYVYFPGDRLSSLQTSPIAIHTKKGYTVAMWIKPFISFPSNEFCLLRGKNPNGIFLEFKCLPQEKEGSYYVAAVSRDDTASDRFTMSSNHWHLVTIRHLTTEDRDTAEICVDGELQFARELIYPKEEEPQGIIWTVGNGFKGLVSSFTLYEQPLTNTVTKFLFGLGPYVSDTKQVIAQAQTSFDSGYFPLGSHFAKGEWSKLCKVPSALSITPLLASLDSVTSCPPDKVGKVQPEYIHMTSPTFERDSAVIVNLNGKCLSNISLGWIESILEGGGVNLLLYLFWTYSALKFEEEELSSVPQERDEEKNKMTPANGNFDGDSFCNISIARDCLIQCLSLMASVIERHVDAREQFIQSHGFHIIASCLSSWPSENIKVFIDTNFIDAIIKLVRAFGHDITSLGDCVASAMQGLLFDFTIWSSLELRVLLDYLTKMSAVCFECTDGLYKYIGMQKMLDIFRISLNKVLVSEKDYNKISYSTDNDLDLTVAQLSNACADKIYRLLIILKDAALNEAQKAAAAAALATSNGGPNGKDAASGNHNAGNGSQTNPVVGTIGPDAEMLLLCLEETGNSLIAERVSRVLSNIRMSSPASLRHAMFSNRFWDTMIVSLWTKRSLSLEVRQHSFVNLIWLLTMELKSVPLAVLQYRKELLDAYNHLERMKNSGAKLRSTLSLDASKIKQLQTKISDVSKGTTYAWKNVVYLSNVLKTALDEGAWGNIRNSCLTKLISPTAEMNEFSTVDANYDFDNLLIAVMNEAQTDTWILIPFLPSLIARVSSETMERVMAVVNVHVKTEEPHAEVISIMEDKTWMDPLVELLLIGIVQNCSSDNIGSLEVLVLNEKMVTEYGTSAELALDTISSILVHKMRMSIDEAAELWDNVHDAFIRIAEAFLFQNKSVQDIFVFNGFTRVICLVLQRLVKISEDHWSISLIKACAPLMKTIHDLNLCGLVSSQSDKTQKVEDTSSKHLLIDLLEDPSNDQQSSRVPPIKLDSVSRCESQLFRLVIDLSHIIRSFSITNPCDHNEWRILKRAYIMLLQNLPNVDESNVELICREVKQHIQHITQLVNNSYDTVGHQSGSNGSSVSSKHLYQQGKIFCPYNPAEYKKVVADTFFGILDKVKILDGLLSMTSSSTTAVNLFVRKQLIATIDLLLQYFRELSAKVDLSLYVQELSFTLGKLCGSTDTELIHKVLRAEWKENIISFADEVGDSSGHGHNSLMDDFETIDSNLAPSQLYPPGDLLDLTSIPDPSTALDLLDYAIPMVLDFGSPEMLEKANSTTESVSLPDSSNSGMLLDLMDANVVPTIEGTEAHVSNLESAKDGNSVTNNATQLGKKPTMEVKFNNWLKVRVGISSERVDTERARMTHSMSLQDLSSDSTRKYWKRIRRKIESESFQQSHRCQWKLGIAHEGPVYGRKRIVLRPRFENLYATLTFENAMKESIAEMEGDVLTESLERALAKECSGYIKDVTRTDTEAGISADNNLDSYKKEEQPRTVGTSEGTIDIAPGTGWGIVDADGSDEGFGVVGLAKDVVAPVTSVVGDDIVASSKGVSKDSKGIATSSKKPVQDMMGELHLLEEKQKHKRSFDTAPCPSGASKCDPSQVKLESRVILVTASGNSWGYLSFNNEELFFRSSFETEDIRKEDSAAVNVSKEHKMRRRRWRLDTISAIYLRRYRLRDSALEVFFRKGKHRNFFVDFGHTREDSKTRTEFAKVLMSVAPNSAFKQYPNMSPFKVVFDHGVQEKWLSGRMSNFDYLMALNTIAGRTYNDLCQYPVMPWVLTDYTSDSLDLSDPKVYRDLSKPMGALNETRLREFLDRFHSFEENTISTGIPAFMYGSHYSTMVGVVLHFLVRLQPFAALHQEMQNGHFDVPDRLFSSVPRSFLHNTTQLSEVKEITPEWFTTPDMFRNVNQFDFGQTQDGEVIGDVELPRWARGSAEEFVRIHREALESDFVSEHLHEWIDLIFGYKQRGPESVDANNVFYYLTYYGAVDHYMIHDESIRKATELQIAHFGQTPMQLFKTPHPAKKVRGPQAQLPLTRSLAKSLQSLFPLPLSSNLPTQSTTSSYGNNNGNGDSIVGDESDPLSASTTSNLVITSDEEQLALDSPLTLVVRKTERAIVSMVVLVDRVLCILDNGVIEVLKYCTSDEAKAALATAQAVRAAAANATINTGNGGTIGRRGSTLPSHDSQGSSNSNRRSSTVSSTLLAAEDILFGDFVDSTNNTIKSNGTKKLISQQAIPQHLAALQPGESMIAVEKEYSHFEVIPKLPLPPRPTKISVTSSNQSLSVVNNRCIISELDFFESMVKFRPSPSNHSTSGSPISYSSFVSSTMTFAEMQARFITFNRSCKLSFAFGRPDGIVSVRELDHRTGAVKSEADFTAHRRRVVSVASDTTIGDYDVVASLDESGQIFVWTILHPKANDMERSYYTLSRRPQKTFRCAPNHPENMQLALSSHMGIVVVVSGGIVYLFSLERNELLRSFKLTYSLHVERPMQGVNLLNGVISDQEQSLQVWNHSHQIRDSTFNGPLEFAFGNKRYFLQKQYSGNGSAVDVNLFDDSPKVFLTRRFVISDFGYVVLHIESFLYEESILEFEDHLIQQHLLLSYTISGQQVGIIQSLSGVTALTCPDHGEIVISGHRDGSVMFYQVQNLALLYKLDPSTNCVQYNLALPGTKLQGTTNPSHVGNFKPQKVTTSTNGNNDSAFANSKKTGDNSPVVAIAVGPNRFAPAIVCISTEAGNVYFKAMPDFIKWEKNRSPSAFAQLASVPLQAVKGTLIQAQNWTAETAGVFAQNAKTFADDAMTELKKMKRNSIVKGVASFFGVKTANDEA